MGLKFHHSDPYSPLGAWKQNVGLTPGYTGNDLKAYTPVINL